MTGEGAGDGNCCCCSPEKRANHTCCCQQKLKLKSDRDASLPDCCRKKGSGQAEATSRGCACGSGKTAALPKLPKGEILPFVFQTGLNFRLTSAKHHDQIRRMATRTGDPPEPPPRLPLFS
jgi:hypothetical protein